MERVIVHTYSYNDRDSLKPLLIAYAIGDSRTCLIDLSKSPAGIPIELRIALQQKNVIKYASDPAETIEALSNDMPDNRGTFCFHWIPLKKLLVYLGFPDDIYTAMKVMGEIAPERGIEEGGRERFCRPDPVFGKRVDTRDFIYQWKALKKTAVWYVESQRYILERFADTLQNYIKTCFYRHTYTRNRYPINMTLYELFADAHDKRIECSLDEYNRYIYSGDRDWQLIHEYATRLKDEISMDYSAIRGYITDGCLKKPDEPERDRYRWAEMLFQTYDLAEDEELILLDYTKCINAVIEWLACMNEDSGYNEFTDMLRISLWQVMNTGKKVCCGRLRVKRKGRYMFISLPSGSRLILSDPSYTFANGCWILEYTGSVNGRMERLNYTGKALVEKMAQIALESYMASLISRFFPRSKMVLCEGYLIMLKLTRGMRFKMNRLMPGTNVWWRKLSVAPEISYRRGAYE